MATGGGEDGDRDMFDTSDSSLNTTQEEGGEEEEEGAYRVISGVRMHASKLWLGGDYLYTSERPNKRILTPTGLQPARHLKCRSYSEGCGGRALVTEQDKLIPKESHPHTCGGGGIAKAAQIEVGVNMRKEQLANPREDPRKIFNKFHGEAAQKHAFDSVRRQMGRIKNSRVPPPPKVPDEAATAISQSIYSTYLQAEIKVDGKIALLWFHPELNAILEEHGVEQEVSCDATFRLVPHFFGTNKQHWSIMLMVGHNFLPAVQVRNTVFSCPLLILVDLIV